MPENSPVNQYQALVAANQISFDNSQQQAVELLEQLYLKLVTKQSWFSHKKTPIKGIYLWGKVGRGKTFLMDVFVASLPNTMCKRQHFHHFMQDVHAQLKACAGRVEPLKYLAKQFSQQYQVLCFDEFFVADIGDAMLLGNLLQYLFERGVVVVSTSNCAPDQLYRNGLQRARFLPAIAAIEQHTDVLHLDGKQDHRKRSLTFEQNYFELPNENDQRAALHFSLLKCFGLESDLPSLHHSPAQSSTAACETKMTILGRELNCITQINDAARRVICFDFSELCQGPRSHFDYVELAKKFHTILLFNVPAMSGQAYERIKARGTEDNGSNINISAGETGEREVMLAPMDDAARRFIALIDECYDSHIELVITADVPQNKLYNNGTLLFEFERTKSRLIEMASVEYRNKTRAREEV
ncbi:cell division protein ZapE [Thalassotalea insulae]|uniref:Cell division protein ZapE n=1 Tax=Thalassotalea insulae TaxID=2056778 RepID=A0ABQ6GV83_9GAMM|nr:cell division protein ZapE [Thalassotalea insulae]GLX79828.1 cell division protein ZapE [Thalassotalea insulae]